MRVRFRRHREITLTDELTNACPRNPAEVLELAANASIARSSYPHALLYASFSGVLSVMAGMASPSGRTRRTIGIDRRDVPCGGSSPKTPPKTG